jgi:hypothetical protein
MAYLPALELIAKHKILDSDCLFIAVRIIGRRVLAGKRSREAVWEGRVAKSEWPILLPAHPTEKSAADSVGTNIYRFDRGW